MKKICLVLSVFCLCFASQKPTIPMVDLNDYFRAETKDKFIEEVKEALHKVGFFAVKNSGMDQKILDDLYDSLQKFYAFDFETRMQVSADKTFGQRGFCVSGAETQKGLTKKDMKEYYMVGRSLDDQLLEKYGLYKNIWPTFIDFKTPAVKFFNHLEEYSELFQEIFSLALGQEKDFFKKICEYGNTSCRMLHYPKNISDEQGVWAGAHTDIDLFTILPRSTSEGLEVLNDEGNWVSAFVGEDALVINGGDFLEIFSNGYFRSSMHRVVKPQSPQDERYSCVHFVHPRSEEFLYPLNEWIKKTGGVKKYAKATRWEMLMERLADLELASDAILKELGESDLMDRLMEVGRASPDALRALVKAGYASEEVKEAASAL